MFTDDELYEIHLATLDVLQNYGVGVHCDEALDIFEDGGAYVDRERNHVKIPSHLVEDAIRSAPSTVLLAGRTPEYDVTLQGGRVGFTSFGAGVMVIDPFTGEFRESNKKDVAATALACDALEHVDVYSSAVVARGAKKFFEMAAVIVGGMDKLKERPLVSALVCPTSPLELHTHTAEIIIECAKAGLPVNVLSMAMSGASAPVSVGGTLVTHNAEVLAGIVLNQLTVKGAPVIYGSSTTTFDLTYATAPVGAPELGMISAGVVALARKYLLPSYVAGS
jgi:trimethylamine--corrinoid protein Co-methyltransferase